MYFYGVRLTLPSLYVLSNNPSVAIKKSNKLGLADAQTFGAVSRGATQDQELVYRRHAWLVAFFKILQVEDARELFIISPNFNTEGEARENDQLQYAFN